MIKDIGTIRRLKEASFNAELTTIYNDCRTPFLRTFTLKYPTVALEELEEIYNDAVLAMYNNVKTGKLTELTCSMQSYINRIGENKIIDIFRQKHVETVPMPEYETADDCERAEEYWQASASPEEEERKNTIYAIVEKLVEPCRKILFSYYYKHLSMDMIAEAMGFASSDVAKTQKSRCMTKMRRVTEIEFRKNGLI